MNDKVELINRINTALDTIRPHLVVDGGNVEVVDVTEEGIVQIKWLGNCEVCSMSIMTMKAGIEQVILSKIPEVKGIEAINGVTV
jgi:Fe-S cluster biogenesis protein NfuA